MKINNINSANFKALLGKKEITYFKKDNKAYKTTIQSIHPFKDEFKSREEALQALDEFKRSDFFKRQNNTSSDYVRIYDAKLECPLPYTKEEHLELMRQSKQSANACKHLTDTDFNCTIFRDEISPPFYVEDGEITFK